MEIIFKHLKKRNAVAKMKKLGTTSNQISIGFCSFYLSRHIPENVNPKEVDKNGYWAITAQSTYHTETTINNMYKSNGFNW